MRPCARLGLVVLAVAVGAAAWGCGGTDTRPASWSYIHAAIIQPNCTTAGCHSGLTAKAGLNLENSDQAYQLLTGHDCGGADAGQSAPRNFVNPGNPDDSQLTYLLRGKEVQRMPPDVPLPEPDIELIDKWIQEGAKCN